MSTIIRVRPEQIPHVWEVIKLAAVRSQEVPESALSAVCQRLLHGLLSETVQCWVTLDEQRTILQVCLTEIRVQQWTGQRELVVLGLYAFRMMPEEDWIANMGFFREVARQHQCTAIVADSRQPRIWRIVERVGWRETSRHYVYPMEGSNGQQ